jgi:hypothetical protein
VSNRQDTRRGEGGPSDKNRGGVSGSQEPILEESFTSQLPLTGSSNMASSIHQTRKKEIKRVYTSLTNGVNPLSLSLSLSREREREREKICENLLPPSRIEYQDKAQQIGSGVEVEAGREGPLKTIRPIRGFLEKLGAEVEDHRSKSTDPVS